MGSCPTISGLLRRLTSWTIAGCLLLLFAGPILTVLITLAMCAAVGLLVWLPMHIFIFGSHCAWRQRLEFALDAGRAKLSQAIKNVRELFLPAAREVLLELICGLVVGTLMGLAAGVGEAGTVIAALLGAAVGAAVVLSRLRGGYAKACVEESRLCLHLRG